MLDLLNNARLVVGVGGQDAERCCCLLLHPSKSYVRFIRMHMKPAAALLLLASAPRHLSTSAMPPAPPYTHTHERRQRYTHPHLHTPTHTRRRRRRYLDADIGGAQACDERRQRSRLHYCRLIAAVLPPSVLVLLYQ